MVDPGPTPRGEKTVQNQDHKRYYTNVRRANAEVSDQFGFHRIGFRRRGRWRGFLKGRRVANKAILAGVHIFPSHLSIEI